MRVAIAYNLILYCLIIKYGAFNLFESKLYVKEYKTGNGENTVDFIKKLSQKNPNSRIIIFWDGASYHKGEEMQKFLAEINQDLNQKNWKITCELFAPYAQSRESNRSCMVIS